jgi:hypothetical protein
VTKQSTFIVVDKHWFNMAGINDILANGRKSQNTGDAHLLMSDDFDISDHRGIWLNHVTTKAVLHRKDNSQVTMKFMIPWRYVLGLGLSEEGSTSIGFKAGEATTLIDTTGGAED